MQVGLPASPRSAASECVDVAVAKKRAVGAWKGMRSSCRVRPPYTPHGAAAFDTCPDLLQVHAEIRVRMAEPRVGLDSLLVFKVGGHPLLSVLPPKKLREPPSDLPRRFLSPSGAKRFALLHLALLWSEVIRSDSEWKALLHFASEGFTLLQSCAEGSKIAHRASKGTGLCSGKA
jgi:hypothetical protein